MTNPTPFGKGLAGILAQAAALAAQRSPALQANIRLAEAGPKIIFIASLAGVTEDQVIEKAGAQAQETGQAVIDVIDAWHNQAMQGTLPPVN